MLEQLKKEFNETFNEQVESIYFAPGRVNLIGEHIDYNGGRVLPFAIKIGTYGLIRRRDDSLIRVISKNFLEEGIIEIDLNNLHKLSSYASYVVGLIEVLRREGKVVDKGMDLYLYGNIPNGSGLSSSASLTVLLGYILNDLFSLDMTNVDIAKLGQKTERFVGVNCGIMDHFASAMGKEKSAIILNTNSLCYDYTVLDLQDYVILVGNTNKKRKLTDSKYNERRAECDKSFDILKQHFAISNLCDLRKENIEKIEKLLNDDVLFRRVRHVVLENERVDEMCLALKNKDLIKAGKILDASHESLKNDYEVTGIELDTIVKTMQSCEGVLGARMVGAGFGGCSIAIAHKDFVSSIKEKTEKIYTDTIGYAPSFYVVEVGDGVKKLF